MISARASRHVVGLVRSVGNEGAKADEAWVRCPRRQESVPVERCRSCSECVEVRLDRLGVPTSVICRVEPETSRHEHREAIDLPRLSVGSLMTRNVLCVRPELSLDAVTELFVESGFKAVPVVDAHGTLLGIVTEADVLIDVYAHQASDQSPTVGDAVPSLGDRMHVAPDVRTVGDVMMPLALTVPENASCTQAAAVMAFEGVYHLAVVSKEGKIVGILSAADILHYLARSDGFVLPAPRRFGI